MEPQAAPLRIEYFWNKNAGKGTEREGVGEDIARQITATPFNVLVHGTKTFEELDAAVCGIVARRPDVIVLSGGDGTLNVVLSRVLRAYECARVPESRLPLFFYVATGTMRLVAKSLGLAKETPERFTADVLAMLVAGGRHVFGDKEHLHAIGGNVPVVRSNILKINDEYGFIYGAGIPVNFLNLYYEGDRLGHFGVGRVLFETLTDELLSALFLSGSQEMLTKPVHGVVRLPEGYDPPTVEHLKHTALMASTIEEIGFGFKGMPLARSESGKFMLRSTKLSFFELGAMAPALALGSSLPGVFDAVVESMTVKWESPTATTIDGEMRAPHDEDIIVCGPELRFLRP